MQKRASFEQLTDDLFERALSDSLRDFVHITRLKDYYSYMSLLLQAVEKIFPSVAGLRDLQIPVKTNQI